jgi:hypothetical protein
VRRCFRLFLAPIILLAQENFGVLPRTRSGGQVQRRQRIEKRPAVVFVEDFKAER